MPVFVKASRRAKAYTRSKPLNLVPRAGKTSVLKAHIAGVNMFNQNHWSPVHKRVIFGALKTSNRDLALKMNVGLRRKIRNTRVPKYF